MRPCPTVSKYGREKLTCFQAVEFERMKWMGLAAFVGDTEITYKISFRNLEGNVSEDGTVMFKVKLGARF